MARFSGMIGFGIPTEIEPGVWDDEIIEKPYLGSIEWDIRRYVSSDRVNDNLNLNNCVSVLADSFLNDNFAYIRYVKWRGLRWTITSAEAVHPRLKFYMGDVYNGPTPN